MRPLYLLITTLVLSHATSAQPAFTTCVGDIGNCSTAASSINLGPATVGGGAFVPVKITNSGSAQLVINYSFSNPAFAFGLSQTLPPNPLVIDPGVSVQTFIVFTPPAVGPQAGQFVSMDNAAGSPHMIPLSGSGVNVASGDFAVMLDPAGPSTIVLKKGSTTTFPVYVLKGANQNPSAGGAARMFRRPGGLFLQPAAQHLRRFRVASEDRRFSDCSGQHEPPAWFILGMGGYAPGFGSARSPPKNGRCSAICGPVPCFMHFLRRRKFRLPPITITAAVNGSPSPHTLTVPVTVQ